MHTPKLLDLNELQTRLLQTSLYTVTPELIDVTRSRCEKIRHGDLARWQQALQSLPSLSDTRYELNTDCINVQVDALSVQSKEQLLNALLALRPWRKGPYSICGIHIDTEWRSDWKWQRVAPHLSALSGRRVLDVGCGSGYHLWRMLGEGAEVALGIDPGLLFNVQFNALQHFIQHPAAFVLPLRLEQLPALGCFDTVFSMGVLYHRREPLQHLAELRNMLASGGELVLETLVIPAGAQTVLVPEQRYARMRNVWQIPTSLTLCHWLEQSGFRNIRIVSEGFTTTDEQRSTDWMPFESLAQSLDPENPTLTIEGYSAPRRVVITCQL